MQPSNSPDSPELQRKAFLWLLVGVSVAFVAILWPYFGAVFWGVVLAIVFAPLNRRYLRMLEGRRTWAALATLGTILLIVILPLALITASLLQEVLAIYERVKTGQLDFNAYFQHLFGLLPSWVTSVLDRMGLNNLARVQAKLAAALTQGSQQLATQAFTIGSNTLDMVVGFFVMLYLAFFLIRDGKGLSKRIGDAVPLADPHKRALNEKFITVIRATVKGNVVVAALQGALGGLIFWLLGIHAPVLWAVVMAFLSLLPAIGAALVWGPVALYFLATGALWQGFALIAFGVLVIGLVDNILRPLLVGKDIRMPDYLVLISTIGGMAIFGINGFVIGPVIAAMFISAWDIFSTTRNAPRGPTPPGAPR